MTDRDVKPEKPCEGCDDKGEVLFMYPRGPGSPPGNQMIPCPKCTPKGDQ